MEHRYFEEIPNLEKRIVLEKAQVELKIYLHFEEISSNKRQVIAGLKMETKI